MSLHRTAHDRMNHCLASGLVGLCALGAWLWLFPGLVVRGEDRASAPLPLNRGVGQKLSNFTLKDAVSGRPFALYGFAGKKAAVLVFLGTDCPLANVYAPRLEELNREYRGKGVAFVGINSNAHESEAAIGEQVRKYGLDFPVLKDPRNVVADLALVERTPEVLVLDGRARVRYRGAIDDQYGTGTRKPQATKHYLKDALDALLAGRSVALTATDVPGCLLDRVEPAVSVSSRSRVRPPSADVVDARKKADKEMSLDVGPVTYASAAARIIQEKCQSCHRPGQVAPFSLRSYDDARKHAAMIHEVVDNQRMPPWHADPRYGHFANDRSLNARERATLLAWVEQGAPLGDPAKLPPERSFPEGWTIGQPDVVFEMAEPFIAPAQGVVEYQHFRVPTGFTEDRWVQAAEAVPGDRAVVHHIIIYVDDHKNRSGKLRQQDLAHLCGYAPGDMPSVYPPGTAKKVPAGSDFIFELHYTPIGRVRTDRSKVGLIFAKAPVTRQAYTVGIVEDGFLIPPHQSNVPVAASMTLAQDTRLLGFMPHMHLRGKDFRYTITRPGKPEAVVLSVPAYDFGWQSYYTLASPMDLPKGTRIDCLAHFDNSDKNPYNPDPSKTVRWGPQTFDEMMIGYIDIDLPRDVSPIREPRLKAELPPPARAALRAVSTLLTGRSQSALRSTGGKTAR
jgi:thiol-disulfide isomerase/thioredoxin